MPDQQSADFGGMISREQAENEFRRAMNLFVGRGRLYSVAQLAKGSGVPARVIDCFRAYAYGHPDYRRLNFGQVMSIARFLGSDFTNEWLHLADQGAFDLPDDQEPDPGALAADNSDDNATITRAAVDGVFDQSERKDLKIVGTRLVSRGATLVALGKQRAA